MAIDGQWRLTAPRPVQRAVVEEQETWIDANGQRDVFRRFPRGRQIPFPTCYPSKLAVTGALSWFFHLFHFGGGGAMGCVALRVGVYRSDWPSLDQGDSQSRPGEFVCFDLGQVVS
jgi:hypothetical protein